VSALDFTEIPVPTKGVQRDEFELFAQEALIALGMAIEEGPNRGPDGGRDLFAIETLNGTICVEKRKWLVSCKHKAHSGGSVTPTDESDISDRLKVHECDGFLGFYSTVPSSGLANKLHSLKREHHVQVFDPARIERELIAKPAGLAVLKRYLPKSHTAWAKENPEAARIFSETPSLACLACGSELLLPDAMGIIVVWKRMRRDPEPQVEFEHLYWCCKGACDRELRATYRADGIVDAWYDIPDLKIPLEFIRLVVTSLNRMHAKRMYSDRAFENLKQLMLNVFPHICRSHTHAENDRIGRLMMIPAVFGGLGN
jgi:hypothetical protein